MSEACENANLITFECGQFKDTLANYSFIFSESKFMCLDSEGNALDSLAEKIEKHRATLVDKVEPGTKVILRLSEANPSGQQFMFAISNFIKENKITELLFGKITILSEKWADLSIEQGYEIE
jgi:hypothetical protein